MVDPLTFRLEKEKPEFFWICPFLGGGLESFRTLLWDQDTPHPRQSQDSI